MKKEFFDYLDVLMEKDPDIYILFAGLGYPRIDEFLTKYPTRAFNTEASEQATLDIAVGLAYDNKIPFVYTITPFLYRGFETIRTYINHERLNVKLIGAGREDDYSKHDGFSHDANDSYQLFNGNTSFFNYIQAYYPETTEELHQNLDEAIETTYPCFINIRR